MKVEAGAGAEPRTRKRQSAHAGATQGVFPGNLEASVSQSRFIAQAFIFGKSWSGKSNGGFSEKGFSNNRFVLKPDVAIASEVSILSKNSLARTDFHAKKTCSTFNY